MFKPLNIGTELIKFRNKQRKQEDILIDEVKNILSSDLIKENKILNNLKFYNQSFEYISEPDVNSDLIFSLEEIKVICTKFRLRFIDSQYYKNEFPYEAILKIKDINSSKRKELKHFKILAPVEAFKNSAENYPCLLFAQTINGNFYLIHTWGKELKWYKKMVLFPLRNFDSLFVSVAVFTLLVDISLPVELITLDRSAPYWCGYRIATYFHLFIFFSGFTAYTIFAFFKNFSNISWNSPAK